MPRASLASRCVFAADWANLLCSDSSIGRRARKQHEASAIVRLGEYTVHCGGVCATVRRVLGADIESIANDYIYFVKDCTCSRFYEMRYDRVNTIV